MEKPEIPFQFVGNDLSLDLINTRVMFEGEMVDLIEARDRLDAWLNEVSNVTPVKHWTASDIAALHALRDACQSVLHAQFSGAQANPRDLGLINSHLKEIGAASHLTQTVNGFAMAADNANLSPRAFLAKVVQSFATLLTETDPKRIRECAHDQCVLVFKDISKSGRRRWCSMETCGNRAKAATFRATSHN